MKECITHYFACDCREARMVKLEKVAKEGIALASTGYHHGVKCPVSIGSPWPCSCELRFLSQAIKELEA